MREKPKSYQTYWGELKPSVDTFPIFYLVIIYGLGIFFPFLIYKDLTLIRLWSYKEHLSELFQFIGYFLAALICFLIIIKNKLALSFKEKILWLFLGLILFFIASEEISILDKIGNGISYLKDANVQNESNLHNLIIYQPFRYLIFVSGCLLLGFFNWIIWPNNFILPDKKYSLYFLFPALFSTIHYLSSLSTNNMDIPYHHEIFEFLVSTGMFLNCYEKHKKLKLNRRKK